MKDKDGELKGLKALDIPKARMNSFKEYMNQNPLEEETDYSLIKNIIQSIPAQNIKLKDNEDKETKLTFQETIDMEYNSMLQELINSINCKVYWDEPNIKFTRTMIKNFLERTLETDRLQTDNIFLTTDLWKKAIFTSKKTVGGGYFNRTINPDIFRINFSELAVRKDENNKVSLPVLTTIQFDNYSNPDGTLKPINYTTQNRLRFERLFSKLSRARDINALYELADLSQDFSIHSYYLPTGISTKNIGNSCLLLRYDHCSLPHYNGAMPPAYRYVYPNVVNEPHFHFNSGFGSL